MEIRIIAENMRDLAGKLEGAGVISAAAAMLSAVYLLRRYGREKSQSGKSFGKICRMVFLVFVTGFLSCQKLPEPVFAQDLDKDVEPVEPEVLISWDTPPDLEKDGIWYYKKAAVVRISETAEEKEAEEEPPEGGQPEEEPQIRFGYRICGKDQDGTWTEITEDNWKGWGIEKIQDTDNTEIKYSLKFNGEIHCKVLAGIQGGEEKEQEIILDWTAPQMESGCVVRQDTGELLKPETGSGQNPDQYWYYSGKRLKAGVRVTDTGEPVSVYCMGTDSRGGSERFREAAVREGEYFTVNIPEEFKGYLCWTGEDILGNSTQWEQPGGFLCETESLHKKHSNIRMEAGEGPAEPGYCQGELSVKILCQDTWSGIRKITVRKDGQIFLEEFLDGRANSWEKLVVVQAAEAVVFLEAEMEDMAGHHLKTSGTWISDKTAPELSVSWEGQKTGDYLSGPGAVNITVREEYFRPELWQVVWEAEPGDGRISDWEKTGEMTYQCRARFTKDGNYILKIQGKDPAGNVLAGENQEGIRKISWAVDSLPPQIEVRGVKDSGQYQSAVTLRIRMSDQWLCQEKNQYLLTGDNHGEIGLQADGEGWMSWSTPAGQDWDDWYHLKVYGEDMAGNRAEQRLDFLINQRGSGYELEGVKNGENLSEISRIIIREKNLSPIQKSTILYNWEGEIKVLEKGKDYTVTKSVDGNYQVWEYRLNTSGFVREGIYSLTIFSEDQAGNRMSNLKNKAAAFPINFTVDRTPPSILISGVEDGGVYRGDKRRTEILVLENMNLKSLRVWKNGREVELPSRGGVLEPVLIEYGTEKGWQTLRVEAEDQAGNRWDQETRTFYLGEPEENTKKGKSVFEESEDEMTDLEKPSYSQGKTVAGIGKKENKKQSKKTGIWLIFCLASYIPLCYNLKVAKNTHADSEKVPVFTGLEKNKKYGED